MTSEEILSLVERNLTNVLKTSAKWRLVNFASYIMPEFELTEFHKVYYEVLNRFAYGR